MKAISPMTTGLEREKREGDFLFCKSLSLFFNPNRAFLWTLCGSAAFLLIGVVFQQVSGDCARLSKCLGKGERLLVVYSDSNSRCLLGASHLRLWSDLIGVGSALDCMC